MKQNLTKYFVKYRLLLWQYSVLALATLGNTTQTQIIIIFSSSHSFSILHSQL
jgi:hypothetical protein